VILALIHLFLGDFDSFLSQFKANASLGFPKPLVYEELPKLAAPRMANEVARHTLQHTVERFRSDYAIRQNTLPKLIEAATKGRQEFLSVREIVHTLRTQVSNLSKNITQMFARFEHAKIPSDVSESDLLNQIAAESKLQSQLGALKNDASNLELALDSATTAAAHTTIQNSIKTREKDIESAAKRRNAHSPWAIFFSKLNRLLLHQQNSAIETLQINTGRALLSFSVGFVLFTALMMLKSTLVSQQSMCGF
jgi:hypothetical protein